jgi:hypothetical protein
MKIPEPIIEPATSIVESSRPSPLTNFCSATGVSGIAVVISAGCTWRTVNHYSGVLRNDKTLGLPSLSHRFKNAKLLSRKKNRVNLTLRDLFKPAPIVPDIFIGFVRCSCAGCRIGCHAAGHLRASRHALRSAAAGALSAKSFNGARFYQRQRGLADD